MWSEIPVPVLVIYGSLLLKNGSAGSSGLHQQCLEDRESRVLSIRSEEDGASGSLRWVVQEIGQAHLILREVTCSMSENIES